MKKILSLIGIMALSTPVSLSAFACSKSISIYSNITDKIKTLNLNSYAALDTPLYIVAESIIKDVRFELIKLNFTDDIKFNIFDNLAIKEIINNETGNPLSFDDYSINNDVLSLKVTVIFNGNNIKLNTCSLTINSFKSDQEISDYINTFNFNAIFNNRNKNILPENNLNLFLKEFPHTILYSLGSYLNIINVDHFSLLTIKNGEKNLTQDDLDKGGKIILNITYTYGTVTNQAISITLNL